MAERRQGKALEDAILNTAWAELIANGYAALTMSDIARKAKTNKNTIYRRWPSKPELIMATISCHIDGDPFMTPDTGALATDLEQLYRQFLPIVAMPPVGTWQKLIPEAILTTQGQVGEIVSGINETNFITSAVTEILAQARLRNEPVRANIGAEQLMLPGLLLINQLLYSGDITVSQIHTLVECVLLPVFMHESK